MTMVPPPPNAGFGYSAGPLPGLPTSPDAKFDSGTTYHRARKALILGLLGIFPLSIVAGIPAIFVGVHAVRVIKASEGDLKGVRTAWCGVVLGCLSCAAFAVLLYRTYS